MLSVIIIVKNEAANLRRCLSSVAWADELIVLDSGSTDDSVAIAKEYTDQVYITDWPGYGVQKQRALERATGDWVLNLDADESVGEELRAAIESAITQDRADAYRVPIRLHFYGKDLNYSWSPKRHIRLFKREGACYSDKMVHEGIVLPPEARVGQLQQPLRHHSFRDISHALTKMNRYSSYTAAMRKKKRPPPLFKTLLSAWWLFFRCYVIQGGFLEGRDGFVLAVLNAHGSFYRGVKVLYEDQEE